MNSLKRCFNTEDALLYLGGIKRRSFETHIRPLLEGKGTKVGTSVIYERSDLDQAWNTYKIQAGRERPTQEGGYEKWGVPKHPAFMPQVTPTKLTKHMQENAFDSAVSKVLKKRKIG